MSTSEIARRNRTYGSDLLWILSTHGLLVGGTPIGSYAYMIEHINTTVDAIIDEMLQLETYLHGSNDTMRARVQTVFKMILLRTCPSPITLHAARRLDATIVNTIHRIMDCVPLLPPEDSIAMRAVLNHIFLPVRLGGDGFINSETTCETAYTASVLDCGPLIHSAVPTLGTTGIVALNILALLDATRSLQAQDVQCIPTVASTLLWTLPLLSNGTGCKTTHGCDDISSYWRTTEWPWCFSSAHN